MNRRHIFLVPAIALAIIFTAGIVGATTSAEASGPTEATAAYDAPECDPNWQVVSSPNVPTYREAHVEAVVDVNNTSTNVWAVGHYSVGIFVYRTLIMHWDGTEWSRIPSPNPGLFTTVYSSRLQSVTAISPNDVWAVGYYELPNNGPHRTLTMHWNGSAWSIVSSPNSSSDNNYLNGVEAISSTNVWAVGSYDGYPSSNPSRTLTMRWNGSAWSVVASPNVGTDDNGLGSVSAVSSTDIWAVGGHSYRTLALHWNGNAWSIVSSPNQGTNTNSLRGVVAVSSNNVWAVGSYFEQSDTNSHTLMLHWNGSSWTSYFGPVGSLNDVDATTSTNVWAVGNGGDDNYYGLSMRWNGSSWSTIVGGTPPNALDVVFLGTIMLSPTNIWAVGYYRDDTFRDHALIERWNGTSWSVVTTLQIDTGSNILTSVEAVSANNIWAVGYYAGPNGSRTLIQHWDGTAWSVVTSPNAANASDNYLLGMAVASSNDIWAVGYSISNTSPFSAKTLVLHWDGIAWSIIPSVNQGTDDNRLHDVAVVSSGNVWAVGDYYNGTNNRTLIMRWNGVSWSVVTSPNQGIGSNYLYGVSIDSVSGNMWAVGYYNNGGTFNTLIERWNGSAWSIVSSPNGTGNNYLMDVEALSSTDAWAVGYRIDAGVTHTLVERWNGTSWSIVSSPNVGTDTYLNAISAVSPTDLWAVGYYYDGTGSHYTLVEHWNGSAWSVVTGPNQPAGERDYLNGVAVVSATDVWAVGYFNNGLINQSLTARYNPCATTSTPTATSTHTRTPTATPTSTHTATPTSTPTVTQVAIFVGHVTWQGRPVQPDSLQRLPITLSLKSVLGEINYPSQTTDASGFFTVSVSGLPGGPYNWRVKGPDGMLKTLATDPPGFLALAGTFTLTGAPLTNVELGLMKAGDANNDNLANVSDFNIMKNAFGKSQGDPGYDNRADFNGDTLISIGDFNLLKNNFGIGGPPPIGPATP